ncbi:unnamed protein product [Dibothriocephalus latus]|uniref:G-protein coupled receptors family 1 profile domain-containing protein n=1 Tax=Dibothriocephalus latus TaxID=60516 RepID=A0A3P6SVL5_DIBLA|nr:unnamed protein product [Dibothriocephalus latus]
MNVTDPRIACLSRQIWVDGPTYTDALQVYREVIGAWLGIPIIVVGTSTSLLSLWMFSVDKSTPRTTRFLLIAVSAADALFLPFAAMHILTYAFCPLSCRLASPLNIFLLASISRIFGNYFEIFRNWIMVLIGIERYVITRHPLKSKAWWTPRKTFQLVLCMAVFCFLVRIPTFTEAIMVNQVLLISMITFAVFMLPYVPLSVLQWSVWRKDIQPSCPIIVAEYILAYLSTLGTLLNSTANFFVYVFYWGKYRKMMYNMLCRYKRGSQKGPSSRHRLAFIMEGENRRSKATPFNQSSSPTTKNHRPMPKSAPR